MSINNKNPLFFFLLTGSIAALLFICCKARVVESSWPKNEIVVNGKFGDWQEPLNYSLSDQFGIGITNDGRFLYICLTAEDRKTTMQMLRSGLTVWFQGSASKRERIGIHFPLGMGGSQGGFRMFRNDEIDTEILRENIEEASQQLEIIGPKRGDSSIMKATIGERYGIQLKLAPAGQNLFYEAKIPLYPDSTAIYALNPGKDSLLDIEIESPAPESGSEGRHEGDNEASSMEPPGGMGGGMGHGSGMSSGAYHGGAHPMPEPLKAAFIIKLAGKPLQ